MCHGPRAARARLSLSLSPAQGCKNVPLGALLCRALPLHCPSPLVAGRASVASRGCSARPRCPRRLSALPCLGPKARGPDPSRTGWTGAPGLGAFLCHRLTVLQGSLRRGGQARAPLSPAVPSKASPAPLRTGSWNFNFPELHGSRAEGRGFLGVPFPGTRSGDGVACNFGVSVSGFCGNLACSVSEPRFPLPARTDRSVA